MTGIFNVLQDISSENVAIVNNLFVSWWSPGQWIFPGILNFLFGWKLGVASIVVTIIFSIFGLIGFYKVLMHFRFQRITIAVSLLIIVLSNTFYNSFIFYQGGEILSFGFFPWFLLYIVRLNKITVVNLVSIMLFFLICFVAKITMIIYCGLIVSYKVLLCYLNNEQASEKRNGRLRYLLLFLPIIVGYFLIHQFFLTKGTVIAFNEYHFDIEDIVLPIATPFTSILSFQTILSRIETFMRGVFNIANYQVVSIVINCVFSVLMFVLLFSYRKRNNIYRHYYLLLLILYIGVVFFFITYYLMNAPIDTSARHYKFIGFLLVPCLVEVAGKYFRTASVLLGFFFLYSILDVVYSKTKWSKGRYIGEAFFYRNHDNIDDVDKLDKESYKQMLAMDRELPLFIERKPVVFFIDANPDVAMVLQHPAVFNRQLSPFGSVAYHGNNAISYLLIEKQRIVDDHGFVKRLLPDYSKTVLIEETKDFYFFRAEK